MPDEESNHIIMTIEEDGRAYVDSPQLPGWTVFADPPPTQATIDRSANLAGMRGLVYYHRQLRRTTPEGDEILLRTANLDLEERHRVFERLWGLLFSDESVMRNGWEIPHEVPRPEGNYLYVCCLATDTLGWLIDQMFENGDSMVLCTLYDEELVWAYPIATSGARIGRDDWHTLAELGFSRETTLSEVLTKLHDGEDGAPVHHRDGLLVGV